MQNGFGEPFWQTGLQNRSFGATALENSFGAQLWGASLSLGSSFGQLSGPALRQVRGSFGQLSGPAFWTSFEAAYEVFGNSFEVFGGFFGTRLAVATLRSSFGGQLWGAILQLCSSIDEQLLGRTTALGSSFRKQLWEVAFGNNFRGQL